MKQLALIFALLILLAPVPTLAGGPKCEPPNPPDDDRPLCPELLWPAAYPSDFDPATADPALYDPSQPGYSSPPPCPGNGLYGECINSYIPVIKNGGFVNISVRGGIPPYTWTIEEQTGNAFSLEESVTQARSNVVHAAGNACGSAKIKVTDSCLGHSQETSGFVKSKGGLWVLKGSNQPTANTGFASFGGTEPSPQFCSTDNVVGNTKYHMVKGWYCVGDSVVPAPECPACLDCQLGDGEGAGCYYWYWYTPHVLLKWIWYEWVCP